MPAIGTDFENIIFLKCKENPDKHKQDIARQCKTRRQPGKKVSPGFENYCI